jgi:hypothetical protein
VDADLDTLATALYVTIDDLLKQHPSGAMAATRGYHARNGLPGSAMAAGGMLSDQLGEVLQQVGWAADAVLGT